MSADPVDADVLDGLKRNAPLTRPRPGHADLAGMQKYGFDEARPILERASARETAARVALGEIAAQFIEQTTGARVVSHVVELGTVRAPAGVIPSHRDVEALDADPVRCFDPSASEAMVAENVSLPLLLLGRPDDARVAGLLDARIRPQFASRPWRAVLTRGEVAMVLATRLAAS